MSSWFGFGPSVDITITFDGVADGSRKTVEIKKANRGEASKKPVHSDRLPLYIGNETVSGTVAVKTAKKVEHNGIKIEFIGHIEMDYDHGNHHEFVTLATELSPPGELTTDLNLPFTFNNVEKQYESYNGINVKLVYFVRFTIAVKKALVNITKEADIWVHNYSVEPEVNNSIKMEVGIEDNLHIEFEYSKSKYHLREVIIGKIYFLLVRLKIKQMELALIRRESTGTGANMYNESETLTKFELMDGAPVRGESIPIRLFLGGFTLTPSYRNVYNKFSVKYSLNLVLIDEEDRRYFKQQEITLYRRQPKPKQITAGAPADTPSGASTSL